MPSIVLSLTIPITKPSDMEYVQRLDLWCNQQGIMLIVGQRKYDVTLRFSGSSQAITDLQNYLQQRSNWFKPIWCYNARQWTQTYTLLRYPTI